MTLSRQGQRVVRRDVSRVEADRPTGRVQDAVAVEEPLEIRVSGDPVAITMRTPGDDSRLAVGFLFAEGIVTSIDDVGKAFHCGRPGAVDYGNVIDVLPGPGISLDVDRVLATRRGTLTTSACGVCGRQSIDDLMDRCRPLPAGPEVPACRILEVIDRLREIQPTFDETGGVHAAAAYTVTGELLACSEDVGRHNAVDKVVGALLYDRLVGQEAPEGRAPMVLAVSSRASFEIVQKAAVARIPIVASVSAASSLAVDLALSSRMTLAGFVRGRGFNVYSHPERITGVTVPG